MSIRKVIERRIRHRGNGVDIAGDVNAVVSANVGEPGKSTHVSSKQTVKTSQSRVGADEEAPTKDRR